MTDRELLELAAKAAGIFITKEQFEKECTSPWEPEWVPVYNKGAKSMSGWRTWYGSSGEIGGWEAYEWQPLDDDGIVFRLALKFGLMIDCSIPGRIQCAGEYGLNLEEYYTELSEDAKAIAARRAIVRVIAKIGRNKEQGDGGGV